MAYDDANIFAKILRGDAPCVKVAEGADWLCFMDIMPAAEGHCLVVPKYPAEDIFSLPPEFAASVIKATQEISRAVKQVLGSDGIVILQLNGEAAGQTVFHLHFHIIPRKANDAPPTLHGRTMVEASTLQPIADKIAKALNS